MTTTTTTHSTTETTPWRLRVAAGVLLLAGVAFMAGVSRPVVEDYMGAWGDHPAQLEIASADLGAIRMSFIPMGVGFAVLGLGLAAWGRAIANTTTGRRARAATILGWVGLVGGLAAALERIVLPLTTAEAVVDPPAGIDVVAAAGYVGVSVAFVGFGVLIMTGRRILPRWLAIVVGLVLVVTGLGPLVIGLPVVYFFGALIWASVALVTLAVRPLPLATS